MAILVLGIPIYMQQPKPFKTSTAAATKDSKTNFLDIIICQILYKSKETIKSKCQPILSTPAEL